MNDTSAELARGGPAPKAFLVENIWLVWAGIHLVCKASQFLLVRAVGHSAAGGGGVSGALSRSSALMITSSLMLGVLQWLALRPSGVRAFWVLATVVGGWLTSLLALVFSFSGAPDRFIRSHGMWPVFAVLLVAIGQWLSFPRAMRQRWLWLIALPLGSVGATICAAELARRAPQIPQPLSVICGSTLGGLVAGIFLREILRSRREPLPAPTGDAALDG